MQKILFLQDNLFSESIDKIIDETAHIDLLTFDSMAELPQSYSIDLYNGIFILVNKITDESLQYIKQLRVYNNEQVVFLLGVSNNRDILTKFSNIDNCFVIEKSEYLTEQIKMLLSQLNDIVKRHDFSLKSINASKHLILYTPENILTVNKTGKILSVNEYFVSNIKYSDSEVQNTNLSEYIPGYSFEEFLSFVNNSEIPKELISTFLDKSGQLIPVKISIQKALQQDDQFYIFLSDRSKILTYKRILDYQNRCFNDLKHLFDHFFYTEPVDLKSNQFKKLIQQVFNCDEVIHCYFKNSVYQNKAEIDYKSINPDEIDIVKALEGLLLAVLKNPEIKTFNFNVENNAQSQILNFGKTVTFIPILNQNIHEVIILLYVNMYDPDQFINDAYKILRDILKQRYKYHELLIGKDQTDQNFKEIVENAVDGIYRSTIEGKIVYANSTFLKMLGYRADELITKQIASDLYLRKGDREEFVENVLHEKFVQNFVTDLKTKQGSKITVLEQARLVSKKTGEQYIEGIIRDISENKQLESNLKNTRVFANELIEKASIIITVRDENDEYLVWNAKAEQVTGYTKNEIIGHKNIPKILYPNEKYRDFVKQQSDEYFFQHTYTPIELKLIAKEGAEKTISWTAVKIKSDTNKDVIVDFGIDITDMRSLEQRFSETKRMELFNSVTDKIAQQYKRLLSSISENLEKLNNENTNEFSAILTDVDQKLKDAHQFSEQILSLSSPQESQSARTDADEVIDHAIYLIKKTIPKAISIDSELNSQGYIALNEAQFNQIILNLTLNSVSAMPDGGKIFITTRVCDAKKEKFLARNNAVNDKYLKVVFNDDGCGMDTDTKKHLFEPFFTNNEDTNHKGLGATLIFNIIRFANGFIDVKSTIDKGTQITFYLPIIQKEQKKTTIENKKNSKILIVDDEQVIRELLNDIAGSDGYKTLTAQDGLDGLKVFEKHHKEIGLAILDIIMPNMSGNELFYKIKKIKPELKVIMIYGYTNPEIKRQLVKDGADAFLSKPFDIKSAREQIRLLLP